MRSIEFTATATRQWLKLDASVRRRIDDKLTAYASTGVGDVRKLVGRPGARLRVGDWRVVFVDDGETIIIMAVGHRSEIYE